MQTATMKPRKMPKTLVPVVFILKNKTPVMRVKTGVSVLRTPAMELDNPVSALVKRKAGIPLPHSPAAMMYFHWDAGIFLMCMMEKGSKQKKEITMRMAATWDDV